MVITEQRREKRAEGEEKRRGEECRAEWAQREKQWKKALICTSDFCKLVYHVSSVTVLHVSSPLPSPCPHPTQTFLFLSRYFNAFLDLNIPINYFILVFFNDKFSGSFTNLFFVSYHFTGLSEYISEPFRSFDPLLGFCVERWCVLLSIRPDWAAEALKVRRRREHQEIYAHKKHELTRGPLTPL